ncbi:GNAT family N-acetyltransferase [Litoreibacter janthinus]|uniref:Acetyltransferase involved in cellulose biosynthesis, CelD/BcsL family n=1 Tax=Litoreibacter janthinus TaxID=670154 RepID=A0A1I6FUV3_9RHOB|nr:GNAT family N-acetyltransferase [Litoreibacter janthinus]SFR33732.1 Acetyltransferase involved in cellulose biosynthesis, CelD/BcsL family [Litoreibacter janthinus]
MTLIVEPIHDPKTLTAEWEVLCSECSDPDVYLQPFFLLTWLDFCKELWTPNFLAVRDAGRLMGLLPICSRSSAGCRILGFPVAGSTPAMDLIAVEGREAAVSKAIAQYLSSQSDWDLLLLHMLDAERAPAAALIEELTASGQLETRDAGATYFVETKGTTPDDFFAGRPRRFRKELERWTRRHHDLGEIKDVICPEDIDLPTAMGMIDAVLKHSWKGDEEDNSDTLARLTDLSKAALKNDALRIAIKLVDGRPTSYLMSFLHEKILFPYHIAYDLELRQIGPGQVQLRREIIKCLEGMADGVDLGGGFSYLSKWATSERNFVEARLVRSSMRSKLAAKVYLSQKDRRHKEARERVEQLKSDKKQEIKADLGN